MSNKLTFLIGIIGVTLFVVSSIIGGFLLESYNPITQYISETYAIDTEHGEKLRIFGYIPSGILITIFCFVGIKKFTASNLTKAGFYGLGIFYGIATIIAGVFPCDKGCNREFIDPSISQVIHNLIGFLTYVFVPISLIMIGLGLKQSQHYDGLSKKAIACGIVSSLVVALLVSNPSSNYIGLYQRIIEGTFIIWIILCAIFIKNLTPAGNTMSSVP